MDAQGGILELLEKTDAEAVMRSRRAVIIQPGAIGDCILTLPLAGFLKKSLKLGAVDMFGRVDYIGIFPGRTCVDGIRSLDSMNLHKLFASSADFEIGKDQALADAFAEYSWIVSFLGEPGSDFEKNLIFTANCTRPAEVITLSLKGLENLNEHIADFYITQIGGECHLPVKSSALPQSGHLIKAKVADLKTGTELLRTVALDAKDKIALLHPGSGDLNKCWHLANFLAAAETLRAYGFEPVFLLGPAEHERFGPAKIAAIAETAECLSELSLTQVLQLLSCVDCFIGNDSGITHLAAAMGVRTIAVFGPTNPVLYKPLGTNVTVLSVDDSGFAAKPSPDMQQRLIELLVRPRL